MAAMILMMISAGILLLLGSIHLVYTFHGPKLLPRDVELQARMSEVCPVITRETSIWRAWIGFNASHGMGAMLFGLVYGYLACAHGAVLFQSSFLLLVGSLMLGGFVVLSRAYWFTIPLVGSSIALACYIASIVLSRI